ncbi:MAG TPA: lipopolysaccharide assembly protein LapA domain-containing protein [Solirubrobacteraceae bacterium]|nr:lipopolysaccharide assembly protein LapA domain-containing protein [Solirubrobacteraceae bacterium]
MSSTRSGDAPERRPGEGLPPEPPPAGTRTPEGPGSGAPEPAGAPTPGEHAGEVPASRTGTAFTSLIAGAIVLILLLVFILENTESVKITYFGVGGHLPLGVALLIAAVGGALLAGIIGGARVLQLRRHVRRHKL